MDITIVVTDEQDEVLREMGVKQFGLDITATSTDVLNFIVESNTNAQVEQKLNTEFTALSLAVRRYLLDHINDMMPPGPEPI